MTELTAEKESLTPVNGWREAVHLPVVSEPKPWNLDQLENLLWKSIEAVGKQALEDNDGKIYTTLSGGVDSTFCLAILAYLFPQAEIHTFTVGGSERNPDVQFARDAAKLFNTVHHEIIIGREEKEELIGEYRDFYGDTPQTQALLETGNLNPWAVYREIAKLGAKSVVVHDGIDELMGGYWAHCEASGNPEEQESVFRNFWARLEDEQTLPLETTTQHFGIRLLFPYLQKALVEYISHIPVSERASVIITQRQGEEWREPDRKKPLRVLARRYFDQFLALRGIPDRQKRGFIDALLEK